MLISKHVDSLAIIFPQTNQAIKDAMRSVLNDARDSDIKETLEGYQAELLTIKSYLEPKKKQTLDKDDAGNIVSNVNAHTGARELASLAKRIQERAVSTDTKEAKRAFDFCVLYSKIATYRDAVLEEVIDLFKKAGRNLTVPFRSCIYSNSAFINTKPVSSNISNIMYCLYF